MSNCQDAETFAELFKALGNPHRVRIYLALADCCAPGTVCSVEEAQRACVGELGADLGIAPSTLSHHMKELSRAGLIRMERQGRRIDCRVDPAMAERAARFFRFGRELPPNDPQPGEGTASAVPPSDEI
ncbi:ArsR/SmtB family transcription factor [Endothiovibrio diazotrophicus]